MHTTRIVSFPLGLLSCAMMEQFTQVMIFLDKYLILINLFLSLSLPPVFEFRAGIQIIEVSP